MSKPEEIVTEAVEETLSFWAQHRFMLLVGMTIVVSIVLVIISVIMYNVSGASQLDLSRPGYQSVSNQVDQTDEIDEYSGTGSFNKAAADEFTKLYDAQAAKAKAVDAFNGDPLNPEVLEFGISSNE